LFDFQRHQRLIEIGFWLIYLGTNAVIDALSVITEYQRHGQPLKSWEPFVWEFSSVLLVGLLVFAVARLNQLFRFSKDSWGMPLAVHMLATVPFSLIHVGGMVGLRKLAYWLAGGSYDFGNLPVELFYEFRKDFVTYWFIIGVIYVWQHLRFLSAVRPEPERGPSRPLERLIARKRDREFVINAGDIDWIEASGNYANLHHRDGIFPVRASMGELERRLDSERFARVHRSHIVNLDRVKEILPTASGDYRIHLIDGQEIRFSRRYRAQLKGRLNI
jgi:hypothetical protein